MSHYTTITTKLIAVETIKEALKEMGFSIKCGENLPLYNYMGDKISKTADIVISRQQLNSASNDIGLKKVGNSYEIIISDYDSAKIKTKNFVKDLTQKYAYLHVKKELARTNFSIMKEYVLEDGTIQIMAER
jgi:hypothetical protein